MNTYLNKMQKLLLTIALFAVTSISFSTLESIAQDQGPEGYCTPESWANDNGATSTGVFPEYRCYPSWYPTYNDNYESYERAVVNYVKIYPVGSPSDYVLYSNLGDDYTESCYRLILFGDYNGEGELSPGEEYTIEVGATAFEGTSYGSNYCSSYTQALELRVFADWNMDADFDDHHFEVDPKNEFINDEETYGAENVERIKIDASTETCTMAVFYNNFTVPEDVEFKRFRIRTIAGYGYGYSSGSWYINQYGDSWGGTGHREFAHNACVPYYYYGTPPNLTSFYDYGGTVDHVVGIGISVKETFPSNVEGKNILLANEAYNGETRARQDRPDDPEVLFPHPSVTLGGAMKEGTTMTYQIYGPYPIPVDESKALVYEALDPNAAGEETVIDMSGSVWGEQTFIPMDKARGKYASADGSFKASIGGEYELRVVVSLPGKKPAVLKKRFTVSWANDVSTTGVTSPTTDGFPRYYKYPQNEVVDMIAKFANTGLNPVYKFKANYTVMSPDGSVVVDKDTIYDVTKNGEPPVELTDVVFINFGKYRTEELGQYTVTTSCELLNGVDQEEYNDFFMRPDMAPYTFATAGEYEGEAFAAVVPADGSSEIVANRPFRPIGDFKNNGISDIASYTNTPIYGVMTFTHVATGYKVTHDVTIESLPAAPEGHNIRSITFPPVSLEKAGLYEAKMRLVTPDDADTSNDEIEFTFEVRDAIEGTFTIGADGDFQTIDQAMEQLYLNGISGPVTFELIDSEYHVGNINSYTPAWDFTSHIIGLSKENTITIKPSANMGVSPAGIKINLYSAIGEGIRFGQSSYNKYKNAFINENLTSVQKEEYANNAGYITIDGGSRKTFHFLMHSGSDKSAAMALYSGSHNITITNSIIENNDAPVVSDFVPCTYYNEKNGNVFENDYSEEYGTFTTAILNRASILNSFNSNNPKDEEGEQAQDISRTNYSIIPNSNNTFSGNDMIGFSYGVMSLGMGPVIEKDANENKYFANYYNKNTVIENNTITNSTAAGIFLGFEEGAVVVNNTIDNVAGANEATGIALGGRAHDNFVGYNNNDVLVLNNKIHNVTANLTAHGIIVEQAHNIYNDPSNGLVTYPTNDDNITIEGNAIWNIEGTTPETVISGIFAGAERKDNVFGTMKNTSATIDGIKIVNNTVAIENDTEAEVWGINVMNVNTVEVINNAISVEASSEEDINAALVFQAKKEGAITSNFNAIYTSKNTDAVRFIEAKQAKNDDDETYLAILNAGSADEFPTLRHWLAWTGQDDKSVSGIDFMNDVVINGNEITIKEGINSSVLSNRGTILDGDHTDLNGVVRGQSDERFDIGALEFAVEPLLVDYEVCNIISPIAYAETAGKLSDAEYIMTPWDIEMSAMIRNNGSTFEPQIPVTFTVYRENLDLNEWEEVANTTVTVAANKDEFATATADINITPITYAEEGWNVPNSDWYGMEENVTPLYKVVVEAGSDLNDANNKLENTYRFYVRRSLKWKVMQSNSSNVTDVETVSGNAYAEAANAHAITESLKNMNLYNVSRLEAKANKEADLEKDLEYRHDVDMMNRNSWPARSLNYDGYKTVVYADGNNDNLTRLNKIQLIDFLEAGTKEKKHNLIIASEEMVRNQQLNDWANNVDPDLDINKVLRIEARYPYSPLGKNDTKDDYADYSGYTVTGITMGGHNTYGISSTEMDGDMYPRPGLFNLNDDEYGIVKIGMIYDEVENNSFPEGGRIMSNTFADIDRNVTVMGVDWRHFDNPTDIMKSAIDVMNSNGGIVNPVELYTFDAKQVGERVELNWSTASETGSSHFDIERADNGTFVKINEVAAKGKSNLLAYYNTTDENVVAGNTYTYRLKMVDTDGTFDYSNEIEVEIDGNGLFTVTDVKPNPVKSTSTFNVTTAELNDVTIELYNTAGTLETVLFEGQINGTRTFEINAAELANGAYTVVIRTADKAETMKVNIVK